MDLDRPLKLFGTPKQTQILVLLGLLEESYPRELSRLTGVSLTAVQSYLESLELVGVLASRLIGKERRVSLNPRFYAYRELQALLQKLAEADKSIQLRAATLRRRPRRKGKEI